MLSVHDDELPAIQEGVADSTPLVPFVADPDDGPPDFLGHDQAYSRHLICRRTASSRPRITVCRRWRESSPGRVRRRSRRGFQPTRRLAAVIAPSRESATTSTGPTVWAT